jgi:hypothetical protein
MKHPSTRAVFDYWNEKRGSRPAPERGDIDPGAIRHALGDTFMLAADFVDQLRFRLSGTRVCALFGREMKGEEFQALWNETSRAQIENLLTVVNEETIGAVAGVTGYAEDGASVDLEFLLLPLAHIGHARVRALGVLTPLVAPYWLGEKPLATLELGVLRHIGAGIEPTTAPDFPRAVETVRLRHGFVVYSGGLEEASDKRTG